MAVSKQQSDFESLHFRVSQEGFPQMKQGPSLISDIASQTGLPEDLMTKELGALVADAGLDSNVVTLDDLRRVLADYVQDILLSAKDAAEQETYAAASGE